MKSRPKTATTADNDILSAHRDPLLEWLFLRGGCRFLNSIQGKIGKEPISRLPIDDHFSMLVKTSSIVSI